jgi:hypothetical protein
MVEGAPTSKTGRFYLILFQLLVKTHRRKLTHFRPFTSFDKAPSLV